MGKKRRPGVFGGIRWQANATLTNSRVWWRTLRKNQKENEKASSKIIEKIQYIVCVPVAYLRVPLIERGVLFRIHNLPQLLCSAFFMIKQLIKLKNGKGRLRRCECNIEVYTQDWHNHCRKVHPKRQNDNISFVFVEQSFDFNSAANLQVKEGLNIQGQDSWATAQGSSNLKSHGRSRSECKSPDRKTVIDKSLHYTNQFNMNTATQMDQQNEVFSDSELDLKIELLKNISLAQITTCIQQQISQSSTRFADSYQYDPSLSSHKEQSPERKTVSGITEQQSTSGYSHEQCNKFIEEKEKRIKQLEEKLSEQDTARLTIELAQVKVRLDERDKELVKTKLEADKQLNEAKVQLKEWQTKEREWLKMFGQVYNLSKDPSFYRDLKMALEGFQESLSNSKAPSAQGSPAQSQNSVDKNAEIIDTTRRYQEHGTYEQIQIDLLEGSQEPDIDIFKHRGFGLVDATVSCHHCSLCRQDFESFGVRFDHYKTCKGLYNCHNIVKDQLKIYQSKADQQQIQIIQAVLDSNGSILQRAMDSVKLIFGLPRLEKEAELWGEDYQELLKLHNEMHHPDYFKGAWLELIAGPVADVNGNPVYAQYASRENLVSVLGKRRRCTKTKIAREVIAKAKQELGIPLSLAERRDSQYVSTKDLLNKYLSEILQIKEWLKVFKGMKSTQPFKKVGGMFCDGFIMPRLKKFFPTYCNMIAYLRGKGLQVQTVCPGSTPDCIYVRIEDSANQFDQSLVDKLNAMVVDLQQRVASGGVFYDTQYLPQENDQSDEEDDAIDILIEPKDVYIRQIDYTQDTSGFFISFDVGGDCKKLAESLRMKTTWDYKSFESCIYLVSEENYGSELQPKMQKQLRFKIYNKLLHFLQSEQGKKKVSMNLKAMLLPSNSFYQKMRECMQSGVSRLEFSHYLYSFEEQKRNTDVKQYQQRIDKTLAQINTISDINYMVPFEKFWKSFWDSAKSVFIFQEDVWTVVYAKNPTSSYTGQQVKVTKGKDRIEFIKRFAVSGKWSLVVDTASGKTYRVMKKGKLQQIPIQSLNAQHQQKYEFEIGNYFKYYMSDYQLDEIELVTESGLFFEFEQSDSHNKKRDKKSKEKIKEEQKGIDVTNLIEEKRDSHGRWKQFNVKGQDMYGSICKFISKDKGSTYHCETCSRLLKANGRTKIPLIMFN